MAAWQCLHCKALETSSLETCCDKEELFCLNDMPGEILRLRAELAARAAPAAPPLTFSVAVVAQRASNGTTHNVSIYRSDRPANAKPWDDGVVTPCNRNDVEEANQEGSEWAKFLSAPFTPGTADAEPITFPSRVPEYGGSVLPGDDVLT